MVAILFLIKIIFFISNFLNQNNYYSGISGRHEIFFQGGGGGGFLQSLPQFFCIFELQMTCVYSKILRHFTVVDIFAFKNCVFWSHFLKETPPGKKGLIIKHFSNDLNTYPSWPFSLFCNNNDPDWPSKKKDPEKKRLPKKFLSSLGGMGKLIQKNCQ